MFAQKTPVLHTFKLSARKEAFSKQEGIVDSDLELKLGSIFYQWLIKKFNEGKLNLAIYPVDEDTCIDLENYLHWPQPEHFEEKPLMVKESVTESKPTKRGMELRSDEGGKYDASEIPGRLALLRNQHTDEIYLGYRKHTYSYYNVCCISPETAANFTRDAGNASAYCKLFNKDGSKRVGINKNYPELYEKWNNFMNSMYYYGIKNTEVI